MCTMTWTNLRLEIPTRKQDGTDQRNGYEHVHMQGVGDSDGDSPSLLDSSLTSLNWLQNLKVLDLFSPDVSIPIIPSSPCSDDEFSWETISSTSEEKKDARLALSPIRKCLHQAAEFRIAPKRFRTLTEKPPFSFTTLIYLAIRHSRLGRITLSEIYRWIKENFKYYRTAEPTWQNSIRHNLSMNEMFVKVARTSSDSRNKGCYWRVNPDYEHILCDENEPYLEHNYSKLHVAKLKTKNRKRTHSHSRCYGEEKKPKRRIKRESNAPPDPCGLPGDLDWVSLLSSQKVSCGSCPSQSCRPAFGSPVLGPPDLGHIGEPVVCSPLIIPTLFSSELIEPPGPSMLVGENKGALLEEVVLKQDSPSPQLLPWAESQSQSPSFHPWAESKESTLHELRNLYKVKPTRTIHHHLSPDSSWSSSCSTTSIRYGKRTQVLSKTCIY